MLFLFSYPTFAQFNVFTEIFPNERVGEAQVALENWTFLYGNIDVGRYMRGTYPGTGIDLAGTENSSIETRNTFILDPGRYTLTFLAQDNTFLNSQLFVEIGTVFSQTYRAGSTPQTYTSTFDVNESTTARIRLTEQGPQDRGGTFIANIMLDYSAPLPVSLLNFTARQNEQQVILDWQTASETNNKGFEIQQSQEGKTWKTIHFTAGKNTTSALSSYSYTADDILSDGPYFRLKQLDNDGAYAYSRIVYLTINLTDDIHVIQHAGSWEIVGVSNPELSLYDLNGILLKHLYPSQQITTDDLPGGLYILAINQNSSAPKVVRIVKH